MKILNTLLLGVLATATVSSCSDDKFEGFYENPAKTTQATCDHLMTGAFWNGNDYTFNKYWRMYTWDNIFGKYAQTIGYKNNTGSDYYYNDGYVNDRWANFYKILAQYRQLENKYNALSDANKENNRIYKDLTEIFVYDHLAQMCDLFGDVPFTKAGMIGITGDLAGSRAPFDNDEDLYKMMIENLGTIYKDLEHYKASGTAMVKATLIAQDFINKGNIDKWLAYANSLRLRMAVQVSLKGSLTAFGQAAVKDCMGRNLVTDDAKGIEVISDKDGFNFWEDFRNGFKDINNVASQPMIDAMTKLGEADQDPRLKVMYSANKDGKYIGTNRSEKNAFQEANGSKFNGFGEKEWKDRYYAALDSATYTDNQLMVSPIVTAAEVDFLQAEAIQRGWAQGNAEQAFVNGMVNSSKFYYRENNMYASAKGKHYTYPGDDVVKAYATRLWASYTDKLDAILTMKWVHFGIFQATQAWTSIRRTGYPMLTYPTDTDAKDIKDLPNRIKYPNSTKASNKQNYDAVVATQGDKSETKLFWAK